MFRSVAQYSFASASLASIVALAFCIQLLISSEISPNMSNKTKNQIVKTSLCRRARTTFSNECSSPTTPSMLCSWSGLPLFEPLALKICTVISVLWILEHVSAKEIIFHVYLNVPGIFWDVLTWGQTRGGVTARLHALAQRTIFFAAIFLSHLRYLLMAFCLAGLLGPRHSYLLLPA